jgi:hypothetical protein
LGVLVVEKYRREVDRLRRSLRPTRPPRPEEIDRWVARWMANLVRQKRIERRNQAAQDPNAGAGEPMDRRMDSRTGRPSSWTNRNRQDDLINSELQAEAEDKGRKQAILAQAAKGWTYAEPNAIEQVAFPPGIFFPPPDLWRAQYTLWLQKDIVNAITETNAEVFEQMGIDWQQGDERANVQYAAVKHLIGIRVDPTYYFGGDAPEPSASQMPSGMAGGRRFTGEYAGRRGGWNRSGQAQADTAEKKAPTLTGMATNKEYDVVRYQFTVVMPFRHVTRLQENLLSSNFHTILSMSMQPAPEPLKQDRYYGAEEVVEVTFEGQLVFLAAWERGTFEQGERGQEGSWSKLYPPLMPIEVLSQLERADATVLRPEDQRRLDEARQNLR